jgi:hypothetical protein
MFARVGCGRSTSILAVLVLFACRSDLRRVGPDRSAGEAEFVPAAANIHEPAAATERALEVGASAPSFSATDSEGRERTLDSLCGRNGVVLLFFRSADW